GNGRRRESRVSQEPEVKVDQALAGELPEATVALEDALETFFAHEADGRLESEEETQRWRPGGATFIGGAAGLLPVKVEPGELRARLSFPGTGRDRDERETWRNHPPLL